MAITIFLKSGSSWVVPSDCAYAVIECIGPGGNGFVNSTTKAGGSGGGGAYASKAGFALTPGAVIPYNVGLGGSQQDTWFFSQTSTGVLAKAGTNASSSAGGLGGASTTSVGDVKNKGGNAGTLSAATRLNGQGAGGAAGPDGVGRNGGIDSNGGGGGGGGSNGGLSTTGSAGGTGVGGNGGKSSEGFAGGARGTSSVAAQDGSLGSGGGGAASASTNALASGGVGGMQPIWTQTSNDEIAGPAGGSGGSSGGGAVTPLQRNATNYGGGAAGSNSGSIKNIGGDGIIIITYVSTTSDVNISVRRSGVWKTLIQGWTRVGGLWKPFTPSVKQSGVWK